MCPIFRKMTILLLLIVLQSLISPKAHAAGNERIVKTKANVKLSGHLERSDAYGTAKDNVTGSLSEECEYKILDWTAEMVNLDLISCKTKVSAGGEGFLDWATIENLPKAPSTNWSYIAEQPDYPRTSVDMDPASGLGRFNIDGFTIRSILAGDESQAGPDLALIPSELITVYAANLAPVPDGTEFSGPTSLDEVFKFRFNPNADHFSGGNQASYKISWLDVAGKMNGTLSYSYNVSWGNSKGEVEVTVETDAGYEEWIPEGDLTNPTKPGNKLTLHCRVHPKGKPDEKREAKLSFALQDVSAEPGVCLNWPAKGSLKDSDLQFLETENADPDLDVKPAIINTKGLVEEVDVVVSAFDYGAHGVLHITAMDKYGKAVTVKVRGEDKADLAIPYDENHNHIADAWEQKWAGGLRGQETDDDDAEPPGDGHTGDALSLYEEYRGLRITGGPELTESGGKPQELITGMHVRTSPKVKDVFVSDTLGMGVGAFRVSGLQVHLVKPEECGAAKAKSFSRHIINSNRNSYSKGEQYVLWIEAGDPGTGYAGEAVMKGGEPSVPRDCQHIVVGAPVASGTPWLRPDQETLVTLTHELAHACNVKHHGDGGTVDVVRAQSIADPGIPQTGEGLLATGTGGSSVSGDVHCYMGYTANFIEEKKEPTVYVWDRKGNRYVATGWNVNSPRFVKYRFCGKPSTWELGPAGGPADGRGDCQHQFCVNHLKH